MNETPTQPTDEGVWDRLRRRKLVQWGVAYAAGAWGFQQGVAYVSTLLDWPVQVQRLTGLALLIGLPIALVLAWYHGDRGQRQVTRSELAVLTVLFLLGGAVFWYFQRESEISTATSSPAPTTAAFATDASIAVLPFVNMSPDKEQEYFADGISEELLNLLAQVPELRVIARTSSFSFKGKDVAIAEIARALNVANVLEGSVRKSGDTLRITAQLVRASDSSHLWSKTYDRSMADVLAIQDEIAAAVVSELKIKLLGVALKPREADPRSHVLFLQARDINRQATAEASKQSIGLYEQALALDPSNAAAWVGLAGAVFLEVASGWRQADDGIPLARKALEKALAVDAEYPRAHSLLADLAVADLDYVAAAQHLERALALAPGDADVVGTAGFLARRLSRIEDAIRLFEYQVNRDPVNYHGHEQLGIAKSRAGRLDEAIAAFRTVLSLAPRSIAEHYYIGEAYLLKGDGKAAFAEMKLEPDEQWRLPGLSMAYHFQGMSSQADDALAELIRKYPTTSAVSGAMVSAFRGDADGAFQWLDKAVQYHDTTLGSIPTEPMFVNLHSDPRWLPFLRKHGMAPEQLAAIKFDVKLPD